MNQPAVIILHHHLRRGGVSKVIMGTSKALGDAGWPHRILCGDSGPDASGLPVSVLPELDYVTTETPSPRELAERLIRFARSNFPTREIIWHVHNSALGKSPSLTAAISLLAEQQQRLVLHHHDFAEDGRAENLSALQPVAKVYPLSPRVVHAFINTRDRERLITAGLPETRAELLKNPCGPAKEMPPSGEKHPLVFLPIRAIPRKNLGETLLLAAAAPQDSRFCVSRAPHESKWQLSYQSWQSLVKELKLPVEFDVSARVPFNEWVQKATHLMTNSVVEGFGLSHLEAIQWNRPLLGRQVMHLRSDLPHQTTNRLYQSIHVPLDWLEVDALHCRTRVALAKHGYASDKASVHQALGGESDPDFGRLPTDLQQEVIRRMAAGDHGLQITTATGASNLTEWIENQLADRSITTPGQQFEEYQIGHYIDRLTQIYQHLAEQDSGPVAYLEKSRILAQFRQPTDFQLICT